MAKGKNAGKFALGALLAGAAGYVAGILTAPKSGKETRTDIKNKAGEVKTKAETELHKAEEELRDLAVKARAHGNRLSGKAKTDLNTAATKAKSAQVKASTVLKAARAGKAKNPELDAAIKQAKDAKNNLLKYLKS